MKNKPQLAVLAGLVGVYALLAFITYAFVPLEQITPGFTGMPADLAAIPGWLLGLANAGIVLVAYGLFGLAGYWFAIRLGLPGIFREAAGWREWLWRPALIGLVAGVLLVMLDRVFAALGDYPGFPHPTFPLSLIGSATAAIGEEILFRSFVLGLWATLLNLALRRWGKTGWALWIANAIAALAFGASHLPAAMILFGAPSPAELPQAVLGELFLLNGLLGLAAGERYLKQGLVAAVGVHFFADIVWHVIWPLFS